MKISLIILTGSSRFPVPPVAGDNFQTKIGVDGVASDAGWDSRPPTSRCRGVWGPPGPGLIRIRRGSLRATDGNLCAPERGGDRQNEPLRWPFIAMM